MSTTTVDPVPVPGSTAVPFIATNPDITIGTYDMKCLASRVAITPDVSTTDVTSFCGTQIFPGNVSWQFSADLFLSYDAGGTEEALCKLLAAYKATGVRPTVTLKPHTGTSSATNPSFTTTVTPQEYGFEWTAGEAATVTIEWACDPPTRTPPCTTP